MESNCRNVFMENTMKKYCYYEAPFGPLMLVGGNAKLEELRFPNQDQSVPAGSDWQEDKQEFKTVIQQLDEYFQGNRTTFDLELAPKGTPFQKSVWKELSNIPFGETINYGELAVRVGNPKASRAVGAANGKNPIPIIVPCHRVIGKNGTLTGFGGGLDVKKQLLELENK